MSEQRFRGDPSRDYQIGKNKESLKRLVTQMGYVEAGSLEELGLTPEETGRLITDRFSDSSGRAYYKVQREDGAVAKAILQARPDRYVGADVFSPGLAGGRASNDDFQWDAELEEILRNAKDKPAA